MKILFAALVVLNIVFFAWQFSRDDGQGEDVAAAQTPGDAPLLLLLGERTDAAGSKKEIETGKEAGAEPDQAEKKKEPVQSRQPDPVNQRAATSCYRIGPFQDKQRAQDFAASSQLASVQAAVEEESMRRRIGFWVKWPEELTLAGARSVMGELRNRGVSDMSITPLDNKHYALSLGIFGTRLYMEQRVDEMRALGYTTIVEDRYKRVTVYWLVMRGVDASIEARLEPLMLQMRDIALVSRDCP